MECKVTENHGVMHVRTWKTEIEEEGVILRLARFQKFL